LRTQTVGSRRGAAAIIAGGLGAAVLLAAVLLATAAGSSSGGYTVRAIFDDAANVISGEDVKIDGVKVGTVGSVTPTPTGKAAVTLNIANPGFQEFRADASCTIKPQALIGEKFVDCLPTQPRPADTSPPPLLHQIPAGYEGAGEWLLPVTNTSSPVDVDLLNDINRLPVRQRLSIILNELGAGLAGRGSDLNAVLRRSNPALRELNKVIGILAAENKILGNLAVEGDRALIPIARDRQQFAEFFAQSNTVQTATARHRGALAQSLADFPVFLRELGPALKRVGQLADQTTPVFTDLGVAAPGINQTFASTPAFAASSTQFFRSFGQAGQKIGPALVASQPLLNRLQTLGSATKPFASNFSALLSSVRSTGGLERLLDFIFLGTNAANGYNSLGHFVRAAAVAKNCVGYQIVPQGGCSANFVGGSGTAAQASGASGASSMSVTMARTLAVLNGASPAQAIAKYPGSPTSTTTLLASELRGSSRATSLTAQPVGGTSAGTTYYAPPSESSQAGGLLLNYLLGN
jgi:phospholipid/cholesterol/gamma-HCH transport system substrate-binding protein